MKLTMIFNLRILVLFMLFIFACSDDESNPKSEFLLADGSTIDLTEANLYLMATCGYSNSQGSFDNRMYYITDGTYNEGFPWIHESYTGATYLLEIDLNVPDGTEFKAGRFPLRRYYDNAPANENFGYLHFKFDEDPAYYESGDFTPAPSVIVHGGFDEGNKMEIEFKGSLKIHGDLDPETVAGKFYFKGVVKNNNGAEEYCL